MNISLWGKPMIIIICAVISTILRNDYKQLELFKLQISKELSNQTIAYRQHLYCNVMMHQFKHVTSIVAAFQCKTDTDCLHDGNCTKCSEYFRASCECAVGYEGANCGKWRTSLSNSIVRAIFQLAMTDWCK